MRVGIDARSLVDPAGRGVARYLRTLLSALATGFPDDEWRALVCGPGDPAAMAPVEIRRIGLPPRAVYAAAGLTGRPRLDRLLGGVDVLWAPAPAPLAVSAGVPLVLTVHDLSWERRPGDFTRYERAWHRAARPRALAQRAAWVIADSEVTRTEAVERWGLRAERAVVAPPPVAVPAVAPGPPDGTEERPYLLWVGALEPRKAPDVLGRAYARARASGLHADLLVVGGGRLAGALAGPGVRHLGRVSDDRLAALYAGALALVMPSRLEGFGLPPLEAALHGTPSIVSDLPIFRSTLGDGALRVPVDDEVALTAAMHRLADDPGLAAALAARAAVAARRFAPAQAARTVHEVLVAAAAGR